MSEQIQQAVASLKAELARDKNGKLMVIPTPTPAAGQKTKMIEDIHGGVHMVPDTGAALVSDGVARHSFFDDDEGEGQSLYSGTVLLDGVKVWVRELTAAEVASYSQGEKEIAEMMRELGEATDKAAAEAKAELLKERQISLYDEVIGRAVARWELKRPDGSPVECTPDAKKKLRISKKAELSDKIVRRSAIGRDLSVFLTEP